MRYEDFTTKDENGVQYLLPMDYTLVDDTLHDFFKNQNIADGILVKTKNGDRLDLLAKQYYNDVNKWHIIARINGLGKRGLLVNANETIFIPNLK